MFPPKNATRAVRIGSLSIGGGHPVAVQSMTATKTRDIDATVVQVQALAAAGAALVRIAVDTRRDVEALRQIRQQTSVNLSVDLQENYRLAEQVAPYVEKIRYNPGHLHHHERNKSWKDKVRYLVEVARDQDCALRIGVNCGSVAPELRGRFEPDDAVSPMLHSAGEHCEFLDNLDFTRYCVSLKDSDPARVVEMNRRFAEGRPNVPLHLGVTEAGLPPEGIVKTRRALVPLLADGIGDTIRVSLTVPNDRRILEVQAGQEILEDVAADRLQSESGMPPAGLNIVCCPSCSRVENEAFVDLAERVRELTRYAQDHALTIAVMGCRVNGPGETDDADLGLWCGPRHVHLKQSGRMLGSFGYDEVLVRLKEELDRLIAQRQREGSLP